MRTCWDLMSTSNARLSDKHLWRAAIIGCGKIAGGYDVNSTTEFINTHAKAYLRHPSVELVAMVEPDQARGEEFARAWGVPLRFTSTTEMLEAANPDIVSICAPDTMHEELLKQCLAGASLRAVWCEKPLGLNTEGAESLVRTYEARGVVLAINYQRQWDPRIQKLRDAIRSGQLGDIQKVLGFYTKGIRHNGSHLVDLLLSWFGLPVSAEVFGSRNDCADDPTLDARLVFEHTTAYLIGVDERSFSLFELDLVGTKGRVQIQNFGYQMSWAQVQPDPLYKDHLMLENPARIEDTGLPQAMLLALDEILNAMEFGEKVRSNGRTALATLKVCNHLAALAQGGA